MKEQVVELRLKIDGLSQLVKELNKAGNYSDKIGKAIHLDYIIQSKEQEKCYDSLILAKAWLGKVLQELGEETPYKNDGNRKTVEDIEPAADKSNHYKKGSSFEESWTPKSHIEKVDWLREEVNKIKAFYNNEIWSRWQEYVSNSIFELDDTIVYYFSYFVQYINEARFWLGFELQRIKEQS